MPHTHEVLGNSRKGQSAIEYLTTYGWMLLVVAIVGGAIFTTVQNSSQIQSTSGLANADVQIDDFGVTEEGFEAELRGASSDQVENVNFSLKDQDNGETVYSSERVTIPVGGTETVTLGGVESGENTNTFDVEIEYDTGSLEDLTAEGTITGRLGLNTTSGESSLSTSDSDFQLSGVSDNGTVNEGEIFGVDYTVKNKGGFLSTQNITLDIDGAQEDVESSLSLSPNDSISSSLEWVTEIGDAGTGISYTLSSENDSVSGSFDVQSAAVSAPSVGGEWSHVKPANTEGGYNYFFDSSTTPFGETYSGKTSVQYASDGFFVMKYQAAQNSTENSLPVSNGDPGWNSISFNDDSAQSGPSSYSACENLDARTTNYDIHLMTNREWMTVVRQVAQMSTNWADNSVGSSGKTGGLYEGNHKDGSGYDRAVDIGEGPNEGVEGSTQRTHELSTGDKVWDLSGGLWQWVDVEEDGTIMNNLNSSKMYEIDPKNSTVSDFGGLQYVWDYNGGEAVLRGGTWYNGDKAGVFATYSRFPAYAHSHLGFRCSAVPKS